MESISPVSNKIASFFQTGFVAGDRLNVLEEEKVEVQRSYDTQSVGDVSLNCITKVDGIARSLYQQAANSAFAVSTEEDASSAGTIKKAYERIKPQDVQEIDAKLPAFMKSYKPGLIFKDIVCKDEQLMEDLSEKAHRTALFVIDLEPNEDELNSETGVRETRRSSITPDRIQCVMIPERYAHLADELARKNIPKEKIIFVPDTTHTVTISTKDPEQNTVSGETASKVSLPNYETTLMEIKSKTQGPIYTHVTRLPS